MRDVILAVLRQAALDGARLRFYYGDTATGQDHLNDRATAGHVARTGDQAFTVRNRRQSLPIPLDQIVRITRLRDGRELYRHPMYHQPTLRLGRNAVGLPTLILAEDKVRYYCGSARMAVELLAFLRGERRICPARDR